MKRWLILLIIFGLVGSLIAMSSCDASGLEDVIVECTCFSISCLGYGVAGTFISCFETCAECPMTEVECNGDPCQFMCDCNIAFMDSCLNGCFEIMSNNVDCSCTVE